MGYAVIAEGLRKRYGDRWVLDAVGLEVAAGSVVALLGPNGAGKTSTVRILSTLTRFDEGKAEVAGFDVAGQAHDVRRRISLVGQGTSLDEIQTGAENLEMLAIMRGMSWKGARDRRRTLLDQFGLADAAGRRVATYSGGMRRRLDLAASLITRPEVIFLDDPTTGLDPRSRQELWTFIETLAGSGVAILLTTQYLEEADRLADRVILIDGGKVVAEGTTESLKVRVGDSRLVLQAGDHVGFDRLAARLHGRVNETDEEALQLQVPTPADARSVRRLLDEVDPDSSLIAAFSIQRPSLEDVFLSLTEREVVGA